MKMNGKKKEFDAVKMMHEIRDKMDREIKTMTFAEEKAYLKKLLAETKSASRPKAVIN